MLCVYCKLYSLLNLFKKKYKSKKIIYFFNKNTYISKGEIYEEMKNLIFSFLCSGNEAKRGVGFRHSTRPRNSEKSEEQKCLNGNPVS